MFFQINDNSFYDTCGNEIIINKSDKLPSLLTQDFLKENFSSSFLNGQICDHKYKFKVSIGEVKQISKNKYDLQISVFPKKKAETEDVVRYLGYSHYILKTEKNNGQIKLKSFKYAYSEM